MTNDEVHEREKPAILTVGPQQRRETNDRTVPMVVEGHAWQIPFFLLAAIDREVRGRANKQSVTNDEARAERISPSTTATTATKRAACCAVAHSLRRFVSFRFRPAARTFSFLVAAVLIFLLFSSLFEYLATAEGKGREAKGSDKVRVFRAGGVVACCCGCSPAGCGGEEGNGQSFVRQRRVEHSRPIQIKASDGYLAVRAGPAR
jgi:hypothetical protein